VTVPVADAAPAIFTDQPLDKGTAAMAAQKGSSFTFFVTGEGIPSTLGIDGRIAAAPLQTPMQTVTVMVNGSPVKVLYAGAAPGYVGLMQVNAQIDDSAASGTFPVVV
jgi:uncharacterized protein (TIGR03437 family)